MGSLVANNDSDGDWFSDDEGGGQVQDGFERRKRGAVDGEEGGKILQDGGVEHGLMEPARGLNLTSGEWRGG